MKSLLLFSLIFCNVIFMQSQELELELVATGFNNPLELKHAGDDRLFVVEQNGIIKILKADATVNPTPFLDISSLINSGGERGLLGLAFHPDYASNGYFYVYYTNNSGNTQISRFTVSSGDADIADSSSELQMLSFNQPFSNHNGGHIAFGPDGMLYIASGDGGSGGDPQNNSQSLSTLLGKLLRIDVDISAPYIPADNPFISDATAMDEIWAYGLRNPWKFSFDEATGDLWIADVGQNAWEEINKEPSTAAGLNYGWRCYEGSTVYDTSGCPPAAQLTFPYAEYARSGGNCSVTGGYVYRGTEFPLLQGIYVFADFCSGDFGLVDTSGNITWEGNLGVELITSFGVDNDNNMYITDFDTGSVHKIVDTSTMSVSEVGNDLFRMYPNPANGIVHFNFPKKNMDKITIYDLKGGLLLNRNVGNKQRETVTLENLSEGMYLIKISSSSGTHFYKKLIIK